MSIKLMLCISVVYAVILVATGLYLQFSRPDSLLSQLPKCLTLLGFTTIADALAILLTAVSSGVELWMMDKITGDSASIGTPKVFIFITPMSVHSDSTQHRTSFIICSLCRNCPQSNNANFSSRRDSFSQV